MHVQLSNGIRFYFSEGVDRGAGVRGWRVLNRGWRGREAGVEGAGSGNRGGGEPGKIGREIDFL